MISNVSGKALKHPIYFETFLPDYFNEKTKGEKSLEQQRRDWERFKSRARAIEKESGIKIFKGKEAKK